MHPQLQEITDELAAASERARGLAGTQGVWSRRPKEGGWSAGECVAHLNLTSEACIPLLREALSAAGSLSGRMPRRLRRDLVGWLLWRMSGPGRGPRVSTVPAFVPSGDLPRETLLGEFDRLQDQLLELIRSAEDLPIHRVRIASAFNPRVKYSVYSGFTILSTHQHRHLEQAERALRSAAA